MAAEAEAAREARAKVSHQFAFILSTFAGLIGHYIIALTLIELEIESASLSTIKWHGIHAI